ncbi:hypothetical protein EVJ58_g3838 [Rhodofomes roseus]|uniref:Uncharacterized protein n=1 Tax=Rhodofomes roseus TaxID=34475 RepID=A0A4Y9YKI3_9APHY|nr:hypothetical protein EVJ58_g3838 [Rhodofomes roseus]
MPLKYQQVARLMHSQSHCNGVTTVLFSPTGGLLASGGLDGRACVWDVATGKLQYVFCGKSAVLSMAWTSPDDTQFACGMQDGTIASCMLSDDSIRIAGFWAHRSPVETLAYNGTQLASGAHKELNIWAQSSGESWTLVAALDLPPKTAHNNGADADLSADGRLLAVSNVLTGFELFAVKNLTELEPMFALNQDVSTGHAIPVRFTHGGNAVIGGTSDGRMFIWDIYTRRKQPLSFHSRTCVLALSSRYDVKTDTFLIVTGVFNHGTPSPVVIWKAQEYYDRRLLGDVLEQPASRNIVLVCITWTITWTAVSLLAILLLLYCVELYCVVYP